MSDNLLKNIKLIDANYLATHSTTFSIPSRLAKRMHEMQKEKAQRQELVPTSSGEHLSSPMRSNRLMTMTDPSSSLVRKNNLESHADTGHIGEQRLCGPGAHIWTVFPADFPFRVVDRVWCISAGRWSDQAGDLFFSRR